MTPTEGATPEQAREELLKAVADAAFEVWWDHEMPSRWFAGSGHSLRDHHKALKRALKAAGYSMQLRVTVLP